MGACQRHNSWEEQAGTRRAVRGVRTESYVCVKTTPLLVLLLVPFCPWQRKLRTCLSMKATSSDLRYSSLMIFGMRHMLASLLSKSTSFRTARLARATFMSRGSPFRVAQRALLCQLILCQCLATSASNGRVRTLALCNAKTSLDYR
jgi:hypothetical protein